MKTKTLLIYFFTLFAILTLGLSVGFYFFNFEKKYALQNALALQQRNALDLITEQIYDDLLIDNTMEVERKIHVMVEKKIIESFSFVKHGEGKSINSDELCQTIYFDKTSKIGEWGKFCLRFNSGRLDEIFLNLRRVTIVVIGLSVFLVLIIIGIFRKISQLNSNLHEGVKQALDTTDSANKANEFWEPVLGQLREESRKKKIAEDQLLQKQIQEEKVLLAQQVSHDIRSPLSVLNLLKDEVVFKDLQRKQLFVEAITRINETANDLLSNSKSELGGVTNLKNEVTEAVEVIPLVESIIAEKKMIMAEASFQLSFSFAATGLKAYCNPSELKRVISNLLNNAIESLDKDEGKIRIDLSRLNRKVQLSITDNGKGIPEDILSRVGTMGFSYGKENSINSGTGLGLYHARQTIESFGGSFVIFSKHNEGTMVVITLNC